MTMTFRIILILASICTTAFMLRKIRHSKVRIEDSIFWLLFSLILIIMSVFPQIPNFLCQLVGIYSTVNFIFLFFIFILLVKLFSMSVKMSQLEDKLRTLTQNIAISQEEKSKEE